ncbi:Cache 3/Cache 2 fusion domain-containing protein [Chitinibacter sp. SCUT-21]|uniref:Cache 3/Cache 2 fusion domain-containing protein n=1 Tax=Chitinibacter sp. SCUT-21 TaxID=2970891 RepID=UPI0035A661F5
MKFIHFKSLASRLLLGLSLAAVMVIVGIIGFVKFSMIPQMTDRALVSTTEALAFSLKETLKHPDQWQESSLAKQNPLLDAYSNEGKAVATLFLWKNGEYTRIATTLKKEDGTRAVGTILKADSPAAIALRAGKAYSGPIVLFKRPHMTTYLPISFPNGVKGSVFIGIDNQSADPMLALARQMDYIAVGVGLISIVLLLVGMVYVMRIERSQSEIDDIMRTTQEGLFLLDGQLKMGSQTSYSLSKILGFAVPAGSHFLELLKPLVSPKTYTTATEYTELLMRHDVKEKLVASLNPLDCIEITALQPNGNMESRFLQIRFNRVIKKDKVTHLLGTANDITRQVKLERELRESERRIQDQMGMMVQILQADPGSLQDFLDRANANLNQMNEVLRSSDPRLGVASLRLDDAMRTLHRLKGDAAALQLDATTQSLHELENQLKTLQQQSNFTAEDLLPIAVRVKALFSEVSSIQEVIARIGQIRNLVTIEPAKPERDPQVLEQPLVKQWQNFVQQLAAKQHKKVELTYQGLQLDQLSPGLSNAINSIVNQFIRNSLVHGVENPQDRMLRGKTEAGHLSVYISDQGDGHVELSFRDDGRGLDIEAIRNAAIQSGRLSAEAAKALDARQLTMMIFETGLSTRKTADEDAGRGIGLDAVKDLIARMGGRIRVGSTRGEYCHFRVQLPLKMKSSITTLIEEVSDEQEAYDRG